jgi:hypothetical protein
VSQPVLSDPRSPTALRHWIFSWPRTSLLSFEWVVSAVSAVSACSSSKNATCMTSLGFRIGEWAGPIPVPNTSQLSEDDLKGGLGLTVTACRYQFSMSLVASILKPTSKATVRSPRFSSCASRAYLFNPSFLIGKSPAFVLTPTRDCATN